MRGTKAKAIRRAVYGDQSLRNRRSYVAVRLGAPDRGETIINDPHGLRARYQKEKRREQVKQ